MAASSSASHSLPISRQAFSKGLLDHGSRRVSLLRLRFLASCWITLDGTGIGWARLAEMSQDVTRKAKCLWNASVLDGRAGSPLPADEGSVTFVPPPMPDGGQRSARPTIPAHLKSDRLQVFNAKSKSPAAVALAAPCHSLPAVTGKSAARTVGLPVVLPVGLPVVSIPFPMCQNCRPLLSPLEPIRQ